MTPLQAGLTLWSFRKELKYVLLAFWGILAIPVVAVLILTQTGLNVVSDTLVNVDEQTQTIEILDPTGATYKEVDLTTTWPANGVITLEFGGSSLYQPFHTGIDIPNPLGSPVAAAEKGIVFFEGWTTSGHGNLVIIRHNNGFETFYAHLSTITVKEGQVVSQGDLIGRVGSTGNSTGSHLHFELHQNGVAQNPLKYFKP